MESLPDNAMQGAAGSAVDIPVGRLPGVVVDHVRAQREVKLQETPLESMLRQFEIAKLDEAKEGPVLRPVDIAVPPDHKPKPARALIVLSSVLGAFVSSGLWVVWRRYAALRREARP